MADVTLDKAHAIAMLGAGGAGMRGLAFLLKGHGKKLTKIDQQADTLTGDDLAGLDFINESEGRDLVHDVDLVVYSDALAADHELRQEAEWLGIPQMPYHEAVGELTANQTTIAVTGTHGKSSTTAMLAHILIGAGLDPSVLVGAAVPSWDDRNARVGNGNLFVVEADEYCDHFLYLTPAHAIVTAVEFDHPDYFSSLEDVERSYSKFLSRVPGSGHIVTHESIVRKHAAIAWPRSVIYPKSGCDDLVLPMPGEHMQRNACLALEMAARLGVAAKQGRASLATWQGIGRRFDRIGSLFGLEIISDYGHHPNEIRAVLRGMRQQSPDRKILAVLEPHMIERVRTFGDLFGQAFADADGVVVVPIFQPKGRDAAGSDAVAAQQELCSRIAQHSGTDLPVTCLRELSALADHLQEAAGRYDVAVGFSAGDLDDHLRSMLTQSDNP